MINTSGKGRELLMNTQLKHWQRIVLLVSLPLFAALALYLVWSGRSRLRCVFYELTGFYCPGCGSGRALQALMHGDLSGAFRHNVLLLPLGVTAALLFLHEYVRLIFPGLRLKPVFVPQWLATGCCMLIFLFWILRNIPLFSFLAP